MMDKSSASHGEQMFRTELTSLLAASGAFEFCDHDLVVGFVEQQELVALSSLSLDSLGLMELCIAVEDRWSVEMSPEQISALSSVNELARYIWARI